MAGETELRPLPRIHERRTTGPRAWRCACVTQVACAAAGMVLKKRGSWACAREPLRKPVGMPRSAGNKTRGLLVGAVPRVLFRPGATCRRKSLCSGRPPLTSALAIGVSHLASGQQRAGAAPATRRARVQVGGMLRLRRQARIAEHARRRPCCRHARRWRRAAARAARRCTSPPAGNARRSGAHPRLRCRHRRRPAPCRARRRRCGPRPAWAIAAGPVIPVHDQGFGLGVRGASLMTARGAAAWRDRRLAPLARPSPATPVIPPALPVPSAAPCPCDPLPCPAPPPSCRRRAGHAPTRPAADSRVSVAIRYRCFHL